MQKNLPKISVVAIFLLVIITIWVNVTKQNAVDHSKLPAKVEDNRGFQRWITNLKNKEFDIGADEFRLLEENEIYNTKWIKIYSIEEKGKQEEFEQTVEAYRNIKKVVFAPNERIFLDYRHETRGEYNPNEAHLYGLKEDKIIDARILDCSIGANCYFDRAYFLDNNVFVISEVSRNIEKHSEEEPMCRDTDVCEYTFKVHVVDLINNKRWVYESIPFYGILVDIIPKL